MWKDYIWNPVTCCFENGKYLANVMGFQQLRMMKLLKKEKHLQQLKNKKNEKNFYIWHNFLLITMALLIAANIYCYLIKYKAKRKHLLPFYFTNNELKEILY